MKVRTHADHGWWLPCELGRDPATGKRRQQTREVRGTRKAERQWRRVPREIDRGEHPWDAPTHTVDALLDHCAQTKWRALAPASRQPRLYMVARYRARRSAPGVSQTCGRHGWKLP